jgi:hypothetical protein
MDTRRSQIGSVAAMVLTNLRISECTRGRPGPLDWDNVHQYRLNLLRCHPVTVSGPNKYERTSPILPEFL